MAGVQPTFGSWDYVVLVLVLTVSSAIGVYYRFTGGKQKTMKEYLLADKNMAITPVAFSLMASFMSAITLLGVSSENYTYGIQFVIINISYGLFTPIAAYLYLPVFFRLQATSAYEYLEKRFGNGARLAASLAYTLQMVLYNGIVLYAPALALEALTGISQLAAILSVGLVCTFYSTMGGMKAVLMTDVFQSLLMFAAVFSVIICAIVDKGSIAEIWRIAQRGNRTDILNFNPDPTVRHSWFSLIIGGGVTFLTLYAVNQTQVQRYLTVKDLKTAQKALWWNWPILSLLSFTTSFSGLCIYSKYYNCDPVTSGYISSVDQLMPYYVVDSMGSIPGISGLFVAGIFSASLSTVSAAVNSLAAVTMEDYVKPVYLKMNGESLTERKCGFLTKIFSICYGLMFVGMAFLAQFMGGVLQAALTIFGVVGGPLLALFSLGMFTVTAEQKGSLAGLACGMALALWAAFGQPRPAAEKLSVSTEGCDNGTLLTLSTMPISSKTYLNTTVILPRADDNTEYFYLYRISYLYNGVLGLLCTFIVGYVVSWLIRKITGDKVKPMDTNLFIPPVAKRLEKMWDKPLNLKEISESDEDVRNGNHKF